MNKEENLNTTVLKHHVQLYLLWDEAGCPRLWNKHVPDTTGQLAAALGKGNPAPWQSQAAPKWKIRFLVSFQEKVCKSHNSKLQSKRYLRPCTHKPHPKLWSATAKGGEARSDSRINETTHFKNHPMSWTIDDWCLDGSELNSFFC